MASILHVDSSPRGDRSKSRKLAKEFMAAWQDLHPLVELASVVNISPTYYASLFKQAWEFRRISM